MKTTLDENTQNMEVMGGKIANMFAFLNFECKKVELMLQSKYFMDSRGQKAYEQIQEDAMTATLSSFEPLTDTTNLKLYEELIAVKTTNIELQEALNKSNQREEELQQKIESLQEKLVTADNETSQGIEGIKEYINLTTWYETMLVEVKKIKDKNSGWIRVQSWESAMEWYINEYPKPKVGTYIVKDDVWGKWVMVQKK